MNAYFIIGAIIAAAAGVFYAIGRFTVGVIQRAGFEEAEAEEAARDREIARKQAEILIQERTPEETADHLDKSTF